MNELRTVRLASGLAVVAAALAAECIAQPQDDGRDIDDERVVEDAGSRDDGAAASSDTLARDGDTSTAAGANAELRDLPSLRALTSGDAGAEQQPRSALPVTRFETLLELNRLADAESYDEALPLAERLIELTEREFGAQSIEAAEAYETAARVQRDAGEHETAERNYLHAIELYRAAQGPYTDQAIAPLLGLGDSYQAAGQYLNAVTVYNEARTINRRVFGLLNEGQIPILDKITDAFQMLDQYADADEQQRTILHLAERNYPEGSPEHIEGLFRYAAWLRESGRYHEERAHYARVMRLVRNTHGKDSVLLVRPLREIANSFREQRLPDNQGMSSLRSALELLDKHDSPNPLMRAEVLRDIGDWEVAFSKVEPNLETYRTAWALLGEVEDGDALRTQWFGELHGVLGEPIDQRGLSRAPGAVAGHVIVMFDVDRFGRTSDVRVARSEPQGFKDAAVVRAIERWRFRPHIDDGSIVPRDDIALQFNYRYLPEDLQPDEQAG